MEKLSVEVDDLHSSWIEVRKRRKVRFADPSSPKPPALNDVGFSGQSCGVSPKPWLNTFAAAAAAAAAGGPKNERVARTPPVQASGMTIFRPPQLLPPPRSPFAPGVQNVGKDLVSGRPPPVAPTPQIRFKTSPLPPQQFHSDKFNTPRPPRY